MRGSLLQCSYVSIGSITDITKGQLQTSLNAKQPPGRHREVAPQPPAQYVQPNS
jgi:hypothetical protein